MQNEVVIGGEPLFNEQRIGEVDLSNKIDGRVEIADGIIVNGESSLNSMQDGNAVLDTEVSGQSDVIFADGSGGSGGTTHHPELTGRSLPNQHPMSAITGLPDALSVKLEAPDLSIINCGTSTEVI